MQAEGQLRERLVLPGSEIRADGKREHVTSKVASRGAPRPRP